MAGVSRSGIPFAGQWLEFSMYTVYIIQSLKNYRYYIGHTIDMEFRLKEHNSGNMRSTKAYIPWEILLTESYHTRSEAHRRESLKLRVIKEE